MRTAGCFVALTLSLRGCRAQGLHYSYQQYRQQADAFQAQARFVPVAWRAPCAGGPATDWRVPPYIAVVGRQAPCAPHNNQRGSRGAGVLVRRTRLATCRVSVTDTRLASRRLVECCEDEVVIDYASDLNTAECVSVAAASCAIAHVLMRTPLCCAATGAASVPARMVPGAAGI